MQIVGVVEPDQFRRTKVATRFNIPDKYRSESVEDFIKAPKFAEGVINGTMDEIHFETTIPILEVGYSS